MTSSLPSEPTKRSRALRVTLWMLATFILIVVPVIIWMKIVLASGNTSSITAMNSFADSPILMVFRWCLYAALVLCWRPLVQRLGAKNPQAIKQSYRPLIVVLVVYELFFAINIISKLA